MLGNGCKSVLHVFTTQGLWSCHVLEVVADCKGDRFLGYKRHHLHIVHFKVTQCYMSNASLDKIGRRKAAGLFGDRAPEW